MADQRCPYFESGNKPDVYNCNLKNDECSSGNYEKCSFYLEQKRGTSDITKKLNGEIAQR